jgi:hypothetical protein
MRISMLSAAIAMSVLSTPLWAQQPPAGGTVVASEPGKAAAMETIKLTAGVAEIDKATRTVTLKTAQGKMLDVVAGPEVKNFDQIKVGDQLVVQYAQALTLEVKKGGGVREIKQDSGAVKAKPGEKPAAVGAREVTIVADVIAVDPKNMTITVKGPRGKVVDLKVKNPEHFKVVKKGDQIEAVYTEALAISIEPAAKK